ncbi:predicted protein [Botrytis cinerea T4]|uniref:Uncharacterized protein n=1 Tax=Botryotinia fuckeliana (strain T4) TaxID=999810 RepID=G2XQF8_BOTF4|nr:predicted protein [Botrytis cinerea T4]
MSYPAPILSIERHFRFALTPKEGHLNEYSKVWQTREPLWKNRLENGWVRVPGVGPHLYTLIQIKSDTLTKTINNRLQILEMQ